MNKYLEEYIKGKKFKEQMSIYRKIREGKIKIIDPNPPKDYYDYLIRLDYSLWFWTIISLVVLTLISIKLSSIFYVFLILRYILGSLFVLFLPGYVTIEALYPREKDLSSLERLALSIGLSLALVPLIGLILNYTPWGIRLDPVIISLTIYSIIISLIASYRKYMLIVYRGNILEVRVQGRKK
jgi:uncharacterized membrane protein